MATKQLTLSIDEQVLRNAEGLATANNTSLSALVSDYLLTLPRGEASVTSSTNGDVGSKLTGPEPSSDLDQDKQRLVQTLKEKYGIDTLPPNLQKAWGLARTSDMRPYSEILGEARMEKYGR